MNSPTAAVWLDAWERGMSATPARRAVAMLEAWHGSESQPARWPLGRRESALLDLRSRLFGDRIDGLASCPQCGAAAECSLRISELTAAFTLPAHDQIETRHAGHRVVFRLPDTEDIELAACVAPQHRRQHLLNRCRIAGDEAPEAGWPDAFVAAAADQMSAADPFGDLTLRLACPDCAREWDEPFDAGHFLWAELNAWAARTMHETHILALAYGWTEQETLALPPNRRRFYLDCAASTFTRA